MCLLVGAVVYVGNVWAVVVMVVLILGVLLLVILV